MAEEIETATDQGNLARLERVGAGTAIASEIFGLVGKSQFFTEFSKEDISTLAGYMEVYRAQPGSPSFCRRPFSRSRSTARC